MHEQEQNRITHLLVLSWYTVLSAGMIWYSLSRREAPLASALLLIGLVGCWTAHLTGKLPVRVRLWLYTVLLMLVFFFFGAHGQFVYDAAPVMLGFMLAYVTTKEHVFVRVCAAVYCFTMLYDFAFLPVGTPELPSWSVGRIALHFLIVFFGERMSEAIIHKFNKEKKHAEETISRLEEANQSAEDFLANVSHELRTPVNAVTGITAALLKNEEDPEKREALLSVQMAGNRLFYRIEDILDYSEIDTGRIQVGEAPYSIPSLVNDVIAEHRLMKRRGDVELIFDVDPGIPALLLGDGRKIKRIIEHLTDNAVKFTKRGGAHIRICALRRPYGVNLRIRVSDTGVGIADDELKKITEKFFQANGGRDRRSGGLGLGLPIVYGMAAAMGGFVRLESREGAGTVVSVSIPQKVADAGRCMEVGSRAELLGLAIYLLPEKYVIPELRDYYDEAISHMVQELDLTVHRIFKLEELKRLVSMAPLSHLFLGNVEYEESASYFEQLGRSVSVTVIADEDFRLPESSRVRLVRKPFFALPIVNILNSGDLSEDGAAGGELLKCPGVRVLVVDDEPMNLMVAQDVLKAWDMEVKTAESGMRAIELCKEAEFDLIFLDHMMPEMDGVETLKELRKLWADTGRKPVVIAFSANVVGGAREMFLREGFDEFIAKPLVDRELKRLLRKLLPGAAAVSAEEDGETATGFHELAKKGFRVEDGLRYCNQDGAFYEEMLTRFAQQAGGKIAQLETALREEDFKTYQILAHTLKSSSKTVGAAALSEQAKDMEAAAKARDAEYLHARHEALLEQYREAAQRIRDALCPAEEAADTAELAKSELLRSLLELKAALTACEADRAEALLAELDGVTYRDTPIRGTAREIQRDVDDFEWDAASGKLNALIGALEGGEAS